MPSTDQASGSPKDSAPRSSVDSGAGAHSPFLHSLHQRFRKTSNSSSTTPEQASPQVDGKSRTDASKDAKKYLLSVVKNDWQFPSSTPASETREPIDYHRREDGLSDIEHDGPQKRRSKSDPYKFESPDAVADFVTARRAKRRRLFEEEMTWNVGLRRWQSERDAWTGALKHRPRRKPRKHVPTTDSKPQLSTTLHERNTSESTTDDSINWPLSPHSPTPQHSSSIDSVDFQQPYTNSLGTIPNFTSQTTTRYNSTYPATLASAADSDTDGEPYLPIYPPLFPPTHVLRSRITPSAYPTIYSKVVIQSLTPNIPIPLTHMTRALVAGWKSEGNWPPAGANPAGEAGTLIDRNSVGGSARGNPSLRSGRGKGKKEESAFAKWRRECTGRNRGVPNPSPTTRRTSSDKRKSSADVNGVSLEGLGIADRPSRVRKSISTLKKALGVNGSNDENNTSSQEKTFSAEKLHLGEVPDIGIDFEEQPEERELMRVEMERFFGRGSQRGFERTEEQRSNWEAAGRWEEGEKRKSRDQAVERRRRSKEEEEGGQRDRELNQGLLGVGEEGRRKSGEKRRSRGLSLGRSPARA